MKVHSGMWQLHVLSFFSRKYFKPLSIIIYNLHAATIADTYPNINTRYKKRLEERQKERELEAEKKAQKKKEKEDKLKAEEGSPR